MTASLRLFAVPVALFASFVVACGGSSFTSAAQDAGASDASSVDSGGGDASGGSDGATGTDGGAVDGGGIGIEAGSCKADAGIFSNIIKACTNDIACVAVDHQVDCCGSMVSLGINHASHNAFNADEAAWKASCPACGCPPAPTAGEDGKPCGPNGCTVACDNGVCRTTGQ